MKICLIPPDSWLHAGTDMHYVLAQRVLQSDVYKDFYAKEDKFKIMDHGIYENDMMDFDDTMKIADEINADEIVLPDEIKIRQPLEFYADLIESLPRNYRYMIVPQGDDPEEWRQSYLELCNLDGIDTIGIPVWLYKDFSARATVVNYMFRKGELNLQKDHHLLGLDNYWELINYPPGVIRSVDTSLPFSMVMAGEKSAWGYDPPEHKRASSDAALFDISAEDLARELKMFKEIARLV